MHTVWGIYQMVMFDSSAYFRKHLKEEESKSANETVSATSASPPSTNSSVATPNVASSTAASLTATASRLTAEKNSTGASHSDIFKEFQRWIYPNGVLLKLTIIMWYVGIMLGCFLAGWFLVRIVQKKNIYVSYNYHYYNYFGFLNLFNVFTQNMLYLLTFCQKRQSKV